MTSGGIIIPKTTNKKTTKKALPNDFTQFSKDLCWFFTHIT